MRAVPLLPQLMLIVLQVLHIVWTFLFLRILWRIVTQDPQKAAQVQGTSTQYWCNRSYLVLFCRGESHLFSTTF